MQRERFLELLATEGDVLVRTAARGLDAPVPPCPGWTVRDVVAHTAEVYEHKMACIRLAGTRPDPGPPPWPTDRDPTVWYAEAHRRLLDVLRTTEPSAPSWTWWPPDQTAGFWVRRMAQETAVHRADVESAFSEITPVDPELARDGIDEVLHLMLAGAWTDDPQPELTGTVEVATDGHRWQIAMSADGVTVAMPAGDATARVCAAPSNLLLWLWGRLPDSAVVIAGDDATARRLRQRLALATQ